MSRYTRLLNDDHQDQSSSTAPPISAFQNNNITSGNKNDPPGNKFTNMFQTLKESATAAGGTVRENMGKASNSVRGGLGLPPSASSEGVDEEEQSVSSSFVEEVSEYCPQMTYQQVSF